MARLLDYLYIFATIIFTVYGQLMLKWRISRFGALPEDLFGKLKFMVHLLMDPGVFSGFLAGFLASITWMAAMSKFDLSHAYPFMSINFVVVLILGTWILSEPMTLQKVIGVSLIVIGTVVAARG
ncbi:MULTISPECIES: EamA family transporter [unclassified Pseudomonas]|uniref:EamA family transporter n=1 Tax=unclassified Pseudomonas TaxID=196821 RepID=UPI001C777C4C|nr:MULTISPECIES: EamA family transporter [unclassified Pseudomonas]MDX9670484.1 EamA family transporter [Pseudomonas sp. P8_250]QXZ12882.1 EamA family transporter [Pseudomonas sp. AO-1]WPN35514.1 EamA family transporter [Pseudomonas sp. P8_139]WPN42684.1 EamA family transporter [Pseudomonas sp. P8_229]